jgi:MFS family permease
MSLSPTKILPEQYHLYKRLTILDRKSLILLNVWGIGIFLVASIIFPLLAGWLRAEGEPAGVSLEMTGWLGIVSFLGLLLGVMLVMIILHEGLHGLFFWLFTHEKPKFAFKGFYAYAAMPDWYMPKKEYLITALAPLVGITVLGIIGLALLPGWADAALVWLLILNTSGAVGDLWIASALLRAPAGVLGRDTGDCSELFVPDKSSSATRLITTN